ncbi:hypothetical protein BU202_05505 [Streptococcus cuniculi]|uniref:Ascorbate-specific PTS system EIIA component n=1 Tax=Streptococcus cuniculi TaxID=1432788 RepID=A0A1Q8E807_9STRE|nr:BglG family transcription antiterminator [Streptococcus cuniculi]OLF47918.1 hypothetical protein BU202_05505 [Streptococcus cuniculi]
MIDRKQAILHHLLTNNQSDEMILKQELGLTSRQLSYAITAINDDLDNLGSPRIVKQDGRFYCSPQSKQLLKDFIHISNLEMTSSSRIKLILLMILSKEDYISLNHFVYVFGYSKNTILTELKKGKEVLTNYRLRLDYNRKTGYEIEGSEWDKRELLKHLIFDLQTTFGIPPLKNFLSDEKVHFSNVEDGLHRIEKFLGMKFTDEDFYQLIPFLALILKRIERNFLIQEFDQKDIQEIKGTKEFQSLYFTEPFSSVTEEELVYISLQLLSSGTSIHAPLRSEDLLELSNSLSEFLTEFEQSALLVFRNRAQLLEKLLNHFKPAYYRIKYHLTFENVMYEQIISKYRILHDFVRNAITPLERFFETSLSDKEIAYITLFIGGHLLAKGEERLEEKTIKAVVVCPNGISFSKLMEQDLRTLFPEFVFYPSISVREYQGFILPHDIVFSSVPLETSKILYLVNTLSLDEEKIQLRRSVISQFFQIDNQVFHVEDLLKIIKKYTSISAEEQLRQDLNRYLLKNSVQVKPEFDQAALSIQGLANLFSLDCIQIIEKEKSWAELLKIVASPLIQKGVIDESYLASLLFEYRDQPKYIMLRQAILLPHLDPTIYAQKLGCSLLVLRNPILYREYDLHFILLMTTPDKTSHLPHLLEVRNLAKNKLLLEKMKEAENSQGILTLLQQKM